MGGAGCSRDQRGQGPGGRLAGVRTSWHTVDDGDFFCPACGGDRSYRRRIGRRRLVLLGVPLLARGEVAPVLECAACHGHFGTEALDHPTTQRLSLLLRDAVHAIALTVLTAGGCESRAAREAAVHTVRSAGYTGCTEDQLLTLLAALSAERDATADSVSAEIELHEALAPLAPHLAAAGRESLLLHGARIALADGPYCPPEREALAAVGRSLRIDEADVDRLLTQARTPH
ncbi:TerB family tellurite resistance protein [Streptomyces abyssalis]|uniref:TerB family tellurite resistance protein n=1 Tax=Streptomyces abyssalis TaxID=933944 RepID=UPI0009A09DA3|nr:TerB family tellurite resistance protein [Streptomyces abyssalis]